MPSCIVKGCPHRTGQKDKFPNVTLHNFPKTIPKIKNWLWQTGQYGEDSDAIAEEILQGLKTCRHRMCSMHFSENCFITLGSKRVLTRNAVPTIFKPQTTPAILAAQEPGPNFPPKKRKRVENVGKPTTMLRVVRLVSSLVTVGTQTDSISNNNATTTDCYKCGIGIFCGKKQPCFPKGSAVQSVSSLEADPCLIKRDHSYPVTFSVPVKSTSELDSELETTKQMAITKQLSTLSEQKENIHQRKFIVFEEMLDSLLYLVKCQHNSNSPCQSPIIEIKKKIDGTMLEIHLSCMAGHDSLVWKSQPLTGQISIGNLAVASAILLSGSSFTKVDQMFKLLSIPLFSHTTYYTYQKRYLFPAIDIAWKNEQEAVKNDMAGNSVVLASDAQVDSPGHSAKYCTYTMMDVMTKKIVSYKIDKVAPGKSLAAVEKSLLESCLANLLSEGIRIKVIATDQNVRISKMMATKYPSINHQFDVWRIGKSLAKNLTAASKKRKCKDIGQWISPITNHLWWCSQTCDQNVDLLLEKWQSLLYHIANKHSFHNLKNYRKCQHKPLSPQEQETRKWITAGHPAYSSLVCILTDPAFIKDISNTDKFCHTRCLKNFHSKILKYRPRRILFRRDSVHARTMLAVLSHNKNVNRPQATILVPKITPLAYSEKPSKIVFPTQKSEWLTKPVYESGTDDHLFDIMSDATKIVKGYLIHR
ncbi:uncharacterized protein cskmt.L isoform X2 [Xenopus laevis]|nr:uncharacterized protein cskmt.L isoform X2 [Xenopus laevis]XP_018113155.1 uncharacterized protein cskmt.L isoform X2 [Xenopus laevis]XP_041445949.1 uncharacterized protein cskmt.L isoform X2 [Xenopus laevis]